MRYAIIVSETGLVENVCEWDGVSEWTPAEGHVAVASDEAGPGWIYDAESQTFSPPAE